MKRRFSTVGTAEGWLQTLAIHTGLIRFEGTGDSATIRPWHRSYQEYLAAEAVALRFANRAEACVSWLLEDRHPQQQRLANAEWQGALRFLIGAAIHQNRASAVGLVEALICAAEEPGKHRARMWVLAAKATAEYAKSFFANEDIRTQLPRKLVAAFERDGRDWPLDLRIEALTVVGRLGDPRLHDPRGVTRFDPDTGWLFVAGGKYETGHESSRTAPRTARGTRDTGGYWIRRWPVVVAEILAFAAETPELADLASKWRLQGTNQPVVNISWHEARRFCGWAQQRWALPCDGLIDLPTSTEWETAARRASDRTFPWGDSDPSKGDDAAAPYNWYLPSPTPVGAFPRGHTPEGLWDMAGNVYEWCATIHSVGRDIDVRIDDRQVPLADSG